MKKFTFAFLTTILLIVFSLTVSGAYQSDRVPSVTMAINEETMVANGTVTQIPKPILVLNKTYVDIYSVAHFLGINLEWCDEPVGFVRAEKGGNTIDFTIISQWDNLTSDSHKFFVKDSSVYVSLRELTDFAGLDITYDSGVITVGAFQKTPDGLFTDVNVYDSNDHVYKVYPALPQHVVYPYQAYSYEMMLSDAQRLQSLYPDLIKTSSIGKSVENRDLLLIEFGRGENKIFVCGAHHAREYITTTYLMYAIDNYSYAYRTNSMWGNYSPKQILDNVTFTIVPMVNPDGVNLVQNGLDATEHASELSQMRIMDNPAAGYRAWKANIRGVDVNWNYDKDWTFERNKNERGSTGFNGDMPYTEPETIAVSNFVDNNYFDAYFSFHSQGQIFYWADDENAPSSIYTAIKNDTGFSGHKESATGVGGSFFDYVYRKFNKPTVTIELCPYVGPYPYPDQKFDTVWKPAKNILLVAGNEILYRKSLTQ